ncbi:hypothetical protein [Streptomyces sp. NBC_00091]|uniref:hypothetical protein n=1 Tax=Streptomyces sp. NBC_00091 TaxID=2975648 RepID=UPI002254DA3C|nr:hypothetical protein [Streptomyces sp. NBC_00091]MCX5378534.1 hypothetical protein [Streptomyces sp. NBC_00091]
MAQHAHTPGQICPNCDGHATVAITLGGRTPAGHLRTITAHCPTCHGTGHRSTRRPQRTVTA